VLALEGKAKSPPHFGSEALLASVESGAIAPLKGSWLIALHKRGGRLKRRQDMPPEAFWTAAELCRLVEKLGKHYALLFVALSYRWLTKDHPDPEGFHLAIIANVAEKYMEQEKENWILGDFLKDAFTEAGIPDQTDFAIFWDFPCLYQKPRTPEQDLLFMPGLRASNIWYGHEGSICWMQTEVPEGFTERMKEAGLALTYGESGWCFVEASISGGVKQGIRQLDLRLRKPWYTNYHDYMHTCAATRKPPLLPDEVRHLLETQKKFTAKADVNIVDQVYRTFFSGVTGFAKELVFRSLKWGDEDAKQLVQVLPQFVSLTTLDLGENQMGMFGGYRIAKALEVTKVLTNLDISANKIGPGGGKAFAEALQVNRVLTKLKLFGCNIGLVGGKAMAEALKVNGVLTSLDLSANQLTGLRGGDMSFVRALAEALRVNGVLTKLDLRYNQLGGAQLVLESCMRDAVSGRCSPLECVT